MNLFRGCRNALLKIGARLTYVFLIGVVWARGAKLVYWLFTFYVRTLFTTCLLDIKRCTEIACHRRDLPSLCGRRKKGRGRGRWKSAKGKENLPNPLPFSLPPIPHPFRRPLGPTLLLIHSFLNFFFFFQYPFAECRFVQMHKLRKNVNVIFQSQYILKIIWLSSQRDFITNCRHVGGPKNPKNPLLFPLSLKSPIFSQFSLKSQFLFFLSGNYWLPMSLKAVDNFYQWLVSNFSYFCEFFS